MAVTCLLVLGVASCDDPGAPCPLCRVPVSSQLSELIVRAACAPQLVRDPRWGRAQEVYSEDPKLTGDLSAKFVQGAQGSSEDGSAEEKELLTVACCKHLAAYDLENFQVGTPPNNGVVDRVHFDANITSRNMWEFYLPAFETCLRDGQAASVMCSFNSVFNTCLPTSCPLQQLKDDLCVPDRSSHH